MTLNQSEEHIRPRTLDDFIGQDDVRGNLKIYLQAAKERGQQLDHCLLYGNPGLGKTTLAQIMAAELGVNMVSTSGPVLERSGDLAAILTSLNRHDLRLSTRFIACLPWWRNPVSRHGGLQAGSHCGAGGARTVKSGGAFTQSDTRVWDC